MILPMLFAVVLVCVVALGALGVCALTIFQMARMHAATVDLLASTLRSKDDHISRAHGSLGMALTEAASRTAEAIGQAVQAAVTPTLAPAQSTSEAAYAVARNVIAGDRVPAEPDDLDVDPTDAWISPAREDLAFVSAGDRNPTGVPGFAFPLPNWPDDLNVPVPNNGK